MAAKYPNSIIFNPPTQVIEYIEKIEHERVKINKKNWVSYVASAVFKLDKKLKKKQKNHTYNTVLYVYMFIVTSFLMLVLAIVPETVGKVVSTVTLLGILAFYCVVSISHDIRMEKLQKHHESYIYNVIIPMLENEHGQFVYNKSHSIYHSYSTFFDSSFSKDFNLIYSEDYLEGRVDGVLTHLGELILGFDMVRDDNGNIQYDQDGNVRYLHNYHFLFFVADFNKNIQSSTILELQNLDDFGCYPSLNTSGHKEILLENTQFNNVFKTYATDEIEARYILTPEFMEKMLHLSGFMRGFFWFQENRMFFFGTGTQGEINLFDMHADETIYNQAEATFVTVRALQYTVQALKLDSIIWK